MHNSKIGKVITTLRVGLCDSCRVTAKRVNQRLAEAAGVAGHSQFEPRCHPILNAFGH